MLRLGAAEVDGQHVTDGRQEFERFGMDLARDNHDGLHFRFASDKNYAYGLPDSAPRRARPRRECLAGSRKGACVGSHLSNGTLQLYCTEPHCRPASMDGFRVIAMATALPRSPRRAAPRML